MNFTFRSFLSGPRRVRVMMWVMMALAVLASLVVESVPSSASASASASAPYNKYRGPNVTSRVVLSFDDCPTTLSQLKSSLAWLTAHDVGAMIFPTGECIVKYRHRYGVNITTLMRAAHQYVGNHSISHPDFTGLRTAAIRHQLDAPGVVTNYGRPPYGARNSRVDWAYGSKHMREVLWTVDTRDWTGKSAAQVVSYVVHTSRPHDMVLMHMQWNGFWPSSLARMVAGLHHRGLQLCRANRTTTPVYLPRTLPC